MVAVSMVLVNIALVLLAASVHAQHLLPASYLSPYDAGWNEIIAAGPTKVPIVIVNPNSGPGAGPSDSDVLAFKSLSQRLQAAGINVFGYSDTSYTRVPVSSVLSEIDKYYAWIGVNGIFLDQTPDNCSLTWYYQEIYTRIKGYGGQALLNPGAPSAECFMAVGDIHLTAEIDYNTYVNGYQTASWVWKYPSTHFYHVAYSVPELSINSTVQLARNRNAGYVFFTNFGLPNPYDKLPSYWPAHLSALLLPGVIPMTETPTTAPAPTTPAPVEPTQVPSQGPSTDEPSTGSGGHTDAPNTHAPVSSRILSGINPISSASLNAVLPFPSNVLVWQSLVLSVNGAGTDLLAGINSYTSFSLTEHVQIFITADDPASAVTIQGDRAYSTGGKMIYELGQPPPGISMTLSVPLWLFNPRPRALLIYGISLDTGARIPTEGSIYVALPAFVAHVFFQYKTATAINTPAEVGDGVRALKDSGASYSDKVDVTNIPTGFSYGWSEESTAVAVEGTCVSFSGRSWKIAVPDSGYYRLRVALSVPAADTCCSVSVGVTPIGHVCNDGFSTTLSPIYERTVRITGNSISIAQSEAALPNPHDPAQSVCELLVTVATGVVMQTTLAVDNEDAVKSEALEAALASLTGENSHRFSVIDTTISTGRVTFVYLIADDSISASNITAAGISAMIQASGAAEWANAGPYRVVTTEVVSAGGSVPAIYMPASAASSSAANGDVKSKHYKTGLIVGLTVGIVCVALLGVALFIFYRKPIWKRDSSWIIEIRPAVSSSRPTVVSSASLAGPTSSSSLNNGSSANIGSTTGLV